MQVSDWRQLPPAQKEQFLLRLRQRAESIQRKKAKPFTQYQSDPVGYAENVLHQKLTDDQIAMIESVRDNRYTAVKASHAIGKSHLAAVAANYWYDCWDEHIVYITAPTWKQALGLTFKQVKMQRRENKLTGRILETGRVLDWDLNKEPKHFIQALNADTGEGFQGEHSAPILIILEEAVGVPYYIWEAVVGLMTVEECRVLAIANPTDNANNFGMACEDSRYNVLSIKALDHPNVEAELQCEPAPFPRAVRLRWLYEMLADETDRVTEKSEDVFEFWKLEDVEAALGGKRLDLNSEKCLYLPTAFFQGRVLGEFPTQADQQVIPRSWLREQIALEPMDINIPEVGCDVARFGDDRTGIGTRRGPCLYRLRELRKMDNLVIESELRDEAIYAARLWKGDAWWTSASSEDRIAAAKKIPIKIDVTGGLGTGPYDHLLAEGYNVIAVNSSQKANNQEQYANKRSELWFDLRDRAREHRLDLSRLPKDIRDKLIRELGSPKYKSPGKKIVEEKAEMKKRLGVSPDLADTVNLAFYQASTIIESSPRGGTKTSQWSRA